MARAAPVYRFQSQFDEFLFASIGTAQSDQPLSVLSALARHDVDPWQEAAELARLPAEAATERLALHITAQVGGAATDPAVRSTAIRLLKFLPHQAIQEILPRETLARVVPVPNSWNVVAFAFFVTFLMWVHFFTATQMASTTSRDNTRLGRQWGFSASTHTRHETMMMGQPCTKGFKRSRVKS